MQYKVDDKIFDNFNDAKNYELSLAKIGEKIDNLRVFSVKVANGDDVLIVVSAEENSYEYVHAFAESTFGWKFIIACNGDVVNRWRIYELSDISHIKNDVRDYILTGSHKYSFYFIDNPKENRDFIKNCQL